MSNAQQPPDLTALLIRHRDDLLRIVRRQGAGLLRFESADDLVQGIHMHVLNVRDRFEYQDEAAFVAWLKEVARRQIADRHHYWNARKRGAQRMIELSGTGSSTSRSPDVDAPSPRTGPVSFAVREEDLELALQAIASLKERDQQLVQWMSQDLPVVEIAAQLGVERGAAERARQRAVERFRKAFEVLLQRKRQT